MKLIFHIFLVLMLTYVPIKLMLVFQFHLRTSSKRKLTKTDKEAFYPINVNQEQFGCFKHIKNDVYARRRNGFLFPYLVKRTAQTPNTLWWRSSCVMIFASVIDVYSYNYTNRLVAPSTNHLLPWTRHSAWRGWVHYISLFGGKHSVEDGYQCNQIKIAKCL